MLRPLFASALLVAGLLTACAPPFAVSTVMPVETAVALTLQAIASAATPPPADTPSPAPTAVPEVLPRPLYFRKQDDAGLWQIFRIQKDGLTVQQISFEPLNVDAYGISAADGSIAFVSNNQLFLVDAAGAGRRMLVDAGPIPQESPWANMLSSPVWSPDGHTIAYGHAGLNFFDLQTGTIHQVLQNQIDTTPGFPLIREIYAPRAYSSDGSRLLIDIGYYEGGTYGIYLPANNALVRLQRADGAIVCCNPYWVPDGSGVYIASPALGITESGLFYADAATGSVDILLPGAAPDGTYNFAHGPHVGPDNQLYFFFNNLPQIPVDGTAPLYLVRSAPDGATDRIELLPDAFQNINEILWDPAASFVVVLLANEPTQTYGGSAQLVYVDGRPGLGLVPFARDLKWGL